MLSLQEAGVNGGAITQVSTGADFTEASFTGTYGDFTLTILGASSLDDVSQSDLLTNNVRLKNNSATSKTLTIYASQDGYTLPTGTILSVESGLGGTVVLGSTISGTGMFQAFADSGNGLLGMSDFTNGPQNANQTGTSFDTGSRTGLFTRTGNYSLTSVVTFTISGGGQGGFQSHVSTTAVPVVKVGDFVWNDANANGIQDSGEPGINGVTLTLTGTTTESGDSVTETTTTSGNGGYLFDNLLPGTYTVTVDASNFTGSGALVGYFASPTGQGGDAALDSNPSPTGTTPGALPGGSEDLTLDFGFYRLAAIGDYVWEDLNANGQQDSGEPGIADVTVKLLDSGNNVVGTTTTDSDGYYHFTGLVPGTYSVQFVTPSGYTATVANTGNDATDSDSVGGTTGSYTLASGETNNTVDAGFYRLAAIGDYVWEDLNANGQQDSGEPGIAGVTVKLLDSGNNVVGTTTTDSDGYYHFTGLVPGSYSVQFVTPSGYTATVANTGNDASDSDSVGGTTGSYTLASGETNNTVDAGFYRLAAIGDYVWEDLNANGQQDSGEPGIADVTVKLLDSGNNVVGTTTTDSDGYYHFTGLVPGTYSVQFVTPSGYTATVANTGNDASDSDSVGGATGSYTLASGETNNTVDAGFYQAVKVGNFVWDDTNANGIQDSGEAGISGVVLNLSGTTGWGASVSDTTTTDSNGGYLFDNLPPGTYTVTVDSSNFGGSGALVGYAASPTFVGALASVDSNASPTGTSPAALPGGADDLTLDFGYYKLVPGIKLEKTTDGSTNTNPVDSDYDNEDAEDGAGVPSLTPGSTVTWTYQVTNTGQVPFTFDEVVVTDDNGTPGDTSDDLSTTASGAKKITFLSEESGNGDNVLDPGEVWLYSASGTVQTLPGTSSGAPVTIYTTGSSSLNGTPGNIRTYSAGGVTVKTSAFSRDKTTGDWATAFLGAFGGGLGVTDTSESGSSDTHTTDNIGTRDNYVLYAFDQSVIVDRITMGYVVGDSDIKVWIGTLPTAFTTPVMLSDAVLASLGFVEVNLASDGSTRTADINNGEYAGNVLVVAANPDDDTPEDRFKLKAVKVTTSGTGVYENKGVVTVPGATDDDLSHYTNSYTPQTPGIDIEKTTNGPSNSNSTAPTYDNEDTASGAGVPILSPGTSVTWTYKVTNTGTMPFAKSDISLVDDAGTPGVTADDMSTANGAITFLSEQSGDGDDVLESGEVWLYSATGTVKTLSSASGSTVSFDFSGSSSTSGTAGNVRSYSSGGIAVKATSFSRDSSGVWKSAFLGAYGGGLGVTDTGESGSSDTHTFDNVGRDNYVLFAFDQSVIVDMAYLGYVVGDSDVKVWIGTLPNAYTTLPSLSDSVLASLGFSQVNLTSSSSARWADFNNGNVSGNVLVIAANPEDDTPDDRFKFELLKVKPSSPGVYENKAVVTVPGASDSDLSHYKNPVSPPPPPPSGSVSGYKFNDKNGDGDWDKNGKDNCYGNSDDETGLSGWTIYVDYDADGVMDDNEPRATTDSNGYYKITGVAPGTWLVNEVNQAGWIRTTDDRCVTVTSGNTVSSVLFGNFKGELVMDGDAATVNFWKSSNGQSLIKSLNGSAYAKNLGYWLADNFPNIYGGYCGSNSLAGKTNAYIADYFKTIACTSGKELDAQVFATILSVYVTDKDWAGGYYASAYGFNVDTYGVKNNYYDLGNNGAAFGVANGTILTVWEILERTNARASYGKLWYGYSSSIKSQALFVFTDLNNDGGVD